MLRRSNKILWASEEKNVWFGRMNFVMFPSQTLRDPDTPPLRLSQETQRPGIILIEELLGDHLQKLFGQYDVPIFVVIIGVTIRVVDFLDVLFEFTICFLATCCIYCH